MKHGTLEIGSYSSGTMREEDLIPTFMGLLEEVDAERAKSYGYANRKALRYLNDDRVKPYSAKEEEDIREQLLWMIDELFDILNDHVPAYCYFGSHPGDGADYGVWMDEETLSEDIRDGSVTSVGDLSELDTLLVDDEFIPSMVLVTNDHGNMTLYHQTATLIENDDGYVINVSTKELWGIV
jgi:hypothetical protein